MRVSVNKPLGIIFREVEANAKRGAYVFEVKEGNAMATERIYKGLLLIQVNGVNVSRASLVEATSVIVGAPLDKPLQLVFVAPRKGTSRT